LSASTPLLTAMVALFFSLIFVTYLIWMFRRLKE
jgi:flagellar biogenesis protein FliO